ncbi:hypothetical protein FOXB_03244 [Fusarium oxysporum f. sp. conglutinans Fo5176]|uniref:Uncharacterized protein n=1 Tax=Fusarium oxysporum (strain Fo5176) TaxID=660025 RepID=F9FA19_FUSOF|nr:hypothetical protein FOXB_03244 [Fusarium oxysporum f. sp. conglutinans Fo5176]
MTQEPEDRTEFTNLLRRKNVTSWSENVGLKRLSNQRSILVATSVIKMIKDKSVSYWQIPDINYFKTYFPILWDEKLQASLPEEAKVWLAVQQDRLDIDWAHAKESLKANWTDVGKSSTRTWEMFLRAWLYVESRAYKDTRYDTVLSSATLQPDDRQVLFPVIDHLTLDPKGCKVHIDKGSYMFETTREYKPRQPIGLLCGNNEIDLLITCGATTQSLESPEAPSNESLLNNTNP